MFAGCQANKDRSDDSSFDATQLEYGTQVTIQVNWTSGEVQSLENIVVNLCPLRPNHVASFLAHIDNSRFDGMPIHRIIPEMYIATGDFEHGDGTGGHAGIDSTGTGDNPTNWTIHPIHSPPLYHAPGVLTTGSDGNSSWGSVFLMLGERADFNILDDSHVPFGRVGSNASLDLITEISEFNRGEANRPRPEVHVLTMIPKQIDYKVAMDACVREAWEA